eukprot:CAMPEP_0170096756 /NCGR_PEP_ID=MMETSP0019_2-20121128/28786_1 /TAXON_ID=98059 /ORGANISM="Dinobryon sp., Strain UTEXLB2267" /LENGTH=359 /DNA_ID=CAMNT_0010318829 /DNA_START=51 /DNA_END=1131 /DNA_ORIENTATION=+
MTPTQELFFPDAVRHLLINDSNSNRESVEWWYWYRRDGMQTSTDDVLVAWIALNKAKSDEESDFQTLFLKNERFNNFQYVDLGCGIGSILLLVSYGLLYKQKELKESGKVEALKAIKSVGIEVQSESAILASRSCKELPTSCNPIISVKQADLRSITRYCSESHSEEPTEEVLSLIQQLRGSCDLLTGNPPYFSPTLGTHSMDSQRRLARFELHGGVEDYCQAARLLLRDCSSRFVFSFPANLDCDRRVCSALQAAELQLTRRTRILMGRPDQTEPSICIYEASLKDLLPDPEKDIDNRQDKNGFDVAQESIIDIRRLQESNKLNPVYYQIQADLHMAKRPLKNPEALETSYNDVLTTI